jgi:pimeloyl-ACP methyl ester carboxylesterase
MASGISAPTLVIAATLDDITPIETQREVAMLYQNAKYREIANVGHLVHYEAPDQAAAMISEFLEELN